MMIKPRAGRRVLASCWAPRPSWGWGWEGALPGCPGTACPPFSLGLGTHAPPSRGCVNHGDVSCSWVHALGVSVDSFLGLQLFQSSHLSQVSSTGFGFSLGEGARLSDF